MDNVIPVAFSFWAVYRFAPYFGFTYFGAHDIYQAYWYSFVWVWLASVLIGHFVVLPLVKLAGNTFRASLNGVRVKTARGKAASKIDVDDIEKIVEQGMIFSYRGAVNRDYHYHDGGRLNTQRIHARFHVQRNTLSMPLRERTAVRTFLTLDALHLLGSTADGLRFALAWGDGRCELSRSSFKTAQMILQQNGIKNMRDLVTHEAGHRDANMESAMNTLITLLQLVAQAKEPHEAVVKLYRLYRMAA